MANTGVWVTVSLIILVLVGGFFLFKEGFSSSSGESEGIVVIDKPPQEESSSLEIEEEITLDDETNQDEVVQTKEFDIIAKQWDFSPNTITVNEGDNVILNIESIDVTHGFVISDFGVSEQLVSGNTVKIEFVADKKGTFSFFCNVFCGSGHSGMRGTLIVQ